MFIDRWPRGITFDRGFRLIGTPLGFVGSTNPGLLFLSSIDDPIPTRECRVLSTPFTAAAIATQSRGLDSLTLEYERKVRLGRMDIRLLSSGLGPGAAQLEIGFGNRRILYCSGVRLSPPLHSPVAEVPKCDLLILDTPPAEPKPPSARTSSRRLAEWTTEQLAGGRIPTVVCNNNLAALDAAWILSKLECTIHASRPLFEMLRRVEPMGFAVPRMVRLNQTWPTEGAVLHLDHLWPKSPFFDQTGGSTAHVGPGRTAPRWASISFRLGEKEDRPGLVSYVKQTGASQVALGPCCDATTASMIEKAGIRVHHVKSPTQMPLPLN